MMARRARAAPAVHGTVTIICVVGGVGVGVEEEAMACGRAGRRHHRLLALAETEAWTKARVSNGKGLVIHNGQAPPVPQQQSATPQRSHTNQAAEKQLNFGAKRAAGDGLREGHRRRRF